MASLTRPGALEDFQCGICLEVCRKRIAETDCCGAVYCWDCSKAVFSNGDRNCPNCRRENFGRHESRKLLRLLNEEAAMCESCKVAILRYGDVEEHNKLCDEAEVRCENELQGLLLDDNKTSCCDWKGKRKELAGHQEECNQLQPMIEKANQLCGGIENRSRSVKDLRGLLKVCTDSKSQVPITPQGLRVELEMRDILLFPSDLLYLLGDGTFLSNVIPKAGFGKNGDREETNDNESAPLNVGKLYRDVINSVLIKMVFVAHCNNRNSYFFCKGANWEPYRSRWEAHVLANFEADCKSANIQDFLTEYKPLRQSCQSLYESHMRIANMIRGQI